MSAFHDNALIGASGQQGYKISRSVRLRSSATAYFNRTPASAGNRKTWTWSGWVKRGTLGSAQVLLSSDVGTSNTTWLEFGFDAADTFTITAYSTDSNTTSAVFRDPSAWYHIVVAFDTTQATAANRCKIYVNGTQQTLTGSGFTLNADYGINNNQIHDIGRRNWSSGVGRYLDGYMTEINFIDGQALTPSSFGETDTVTGVWKPKKYTGTYGTNGFYLNFSDNSATTATTIGKDYSGNGNNWTPNNISITAGVTYDSMLDVPTPYADGGNGRGNYAVFNPVAKASSQPTFSNANLNLSASSAWNGAVGTIGVTSGKWYWEVVNGNGDAFVGICGDNLVLTSADPQTLTGTILYYGGNGDKRIDGTSTAYGATYTTETIGVALDVDGGTITFYKNNTSQGSISLSSSTLNGKTIFPFFVKYASTSVVNFGQRPFSYTPPTGFLALNTQNLPTPTISNGKKYFNTVLYTGDYTTSHPITGVGFQPDFVWIKDRGLTTIYNYPHALFDAVRGAGKWISSNRTDAENDYGTGTTSPFRSFDSDGFTVGQNYNTNEVDPVADYFVAWNWKANGAAVTNTSGSITSTVSANPTAGFSVVTWAGSGAAGTIGHGLNAVPAMLITKKRTSATDSNWVVWHKNLTGGNTVTDAYYMYLNGTNGQNASGGVFYKGTDITSTTFGFQGGNANVNASGQNYVAYCFAEVAGYSAFGKYTGNGSSDGPFVFCGFRPRFILFKSSSAINSWAMYDTSRSTSNTSTARLYADTSAAETTGLQIDILSNGFKWREAGGQGNDSGATYIFAAFAENPFKISLAR